jgi:hypothetical protein
VAGVSQKRLRFLQPSPKQGLLPRHQTIPIVELKPLAQSHFVGNSYEVLLISFPIELNPQRFQGLVPGAMMDALGVGQHAIEIEEQRVVLQVQWTRGICRGDQAIIIS